MARVVLTGGCGFLGQLLAREILKRNTLLTHVTRGGAEATTFVKEVILADIAKPPKMVCEELDFEAQIVVGDLADSGYSKALVSGADGPVSIFHLGAVMSGQGEADFDLCMNVNLYGTLNLLEAARHCGAPRPRFIMASAGATLGAGHPTDFLTKDDTVGDSTRATPHTTYGMTKSCAELLLNDYSRKGFVDYRGVRLPSVLVRAGTPNAATTGCYSGIIREPLAGVDTVMPIGPHVKHAVTSHRKAVESLLRLHDVPAAEVDGVLGFDRTVFVPSLAVSLDELSHAVHDVVTPESRSSLGKVTYDVDEKLSAAVGSFPTKVDSARAQALGLQNDLEVVAMIRQYAEDFPSAIHPAVRLASTEAAAASDAGAGAGSGDAAVALITGGGTGIGRAVALRLAHGDWAEAEKPVALILTGRRRELLEETQREVEAVASARGVSVSTLVLPADLTRGSDVDGLFDAVRRTYGRLDLLFNNAGANVPPTRVDEMSMEHWRKVVGVNLDAAFHVAKEAFVMMKEQTPQGGRIINNGSVSADTPRPGSSAYTASKHGVSGLTKSIALDGRALNIACGQIDFGNVVSAISAGMAVGMPQADGSVRPEPRMTTEEAADAVHAMARLPLSSNVLKMTVMATQMPLVGRG